MTSKMRHALHLFPAFFMGNLNWPLVADAGGIIVLTMQGTCVAATRKQWWRQLCDFIHSFPCVSCIVQNRFKMFI